MYYDIYHTLSYNKLFNFVVGNRGAGKTYAFKKWAIQDFLKNGNQFIYLRRYDTELKRVKTYFADIQKDFPENELHVYKGSFYIDQQEAGYALSLTKGKIEKSTSFPKVNKICFDEFLLDKGYHHYLPDEVQTFLELYETIARMRDVAAFFLSNSISQVNPYFLYFDLKLPWGKNIITKGDLLLEMVADPEFIEAKKQTRFGKLIDGTVYGQYAIENQFLRDDDTFVEKKTKNSSIQFIFFYMGKNYGVWADFKKGLYYVSEDIDPSCQIRYSFTTDDHKPNLLLFKARKASHVKAFLEAYRWGCLRFESIKVKNIAMEVIQMNL